MEISIAGRPRPDLARWEGRPFWPAIAAGPSVSDRRDAYEKEIAREPPGPPLDGGAHRKVATAISRYEIFPPELVRGILRRAPIAVGDTVGICYRFAPAVELFFAARVTEVFDRSDGKTWRSGFTYRTLVGHPELGEETFSVEKELATGAIRVALRSWSRPGTLLAKAFAPIVRQLQVGASVRALEHLAEIAGEG
jgi:hypothetical protein